MRKQHSTAGMRSLSKAFRKGNTPSLISNACCYPRWCWRPRYEVVYRQVLAQVVADFLEVSERDVPRVVLVEQLEHLLDLLPAVPVSHARRHHLDELLQRHLAVQILVQVVEDALDLVLLQLEAQRAHWSEAETARTRQRSQQPASRTQSMHTPLLVCMHVLTGRLEFSQVDAAAVVCVEQVECFPNLLQLLICQTSACGRLLAQSLPVPARATVGGLQAHTTRQQQEGRWVRCLATDSLFAQRCCMLSSPRLLKFELVNLSSLLCASEYAPAALTAACDDAMLLSVCARGSARCVTQGAADWHTQRPISTCLHVTRLNWRVRSMATSRTALPVWQGISAWRWMQATGSHGQPHSLEASSCRCRAPSPEHVNEHMQQPNGTETDTFGPSLRPTRQVRPFFLSWRPEACNTHTCSLQRAGVHPRTGGLGAAASGGVRCF